MLLYLGLKFKNGSGALRAPKLRPCPLSQFGQKEFSRSDEVDDKNNGNHFICPRKFEWGFLKRLFFSLYLYFCDGPETEMMNFGGNSSQDLL